jgi:hypothetical protein
LPGMSYWKMSVDIFAPAPYKSKYGAKLQNSF